jgi:hypothetical protein
MTKKSESDYFCFPPPKSEKNFQQHWESEYFFRKKPFKILNGLALPVLTNLGKEQDHKYNFRYTNLLQIPQVKSSRYGKSSFRYAAPVLWNSLPDNYRNCSNFNEFKNLISFWNGKSCTCIVCQNS